VLPFGKARCMGRIRHFYATRPNCASPATSTWDRRRPLENWLATRGRSSPGWTWTIPGTRPPPTRHAGRVPAQTRRGGHAVALWAMRRRFIVAIAGQGLGDGGFAYAPSSMPAAFSEAYGAMRKKGDTINTVFTLLAADGWMRPAAAGAQAFWLFVGGWASRLASYASQVFKTNPSWWRC